MNDGFGANGAQTFQSFFGGAFDTGDDVSGRAFEFEVIVFDLADAWRSDGLRCLGDDLFLSLNFLASEFFSVEEDGDIEFGTRRFDGRLFAEGDGVIPVDNGDEMFFDGEVFFVVWRGVDAKFQGQDAGDGGGILIDEFAGKVDDGLQGFGGKGVCGGHGQSDSDGECKENFHGIVEVKRR